MKNTSLCPVCQQPFLNEPVVGTLFWRKSCINKINHKLIITLDMKSEMIVNFVLVNSINQSFKFYPLDKVISIYKNLSWQELVKPGCQAPCTNIPYFDPDFKNYNKLLNKLKTYTLFL